MSSYWLDLALWPLPYWVWVHDLYLLYVSAVMEVGTVICCWRSTLMTAPTSCPCRNTIAMVTSVFTGNKQACCRLVLYLSVRFRFWHLYALSAAVSSCIYLYASGFDIYMLYQAKWRTLPMCIYDPFKKPQKFSKENFRQKLWMFNFRLNQ